jgi:sugar lactone lactonase YvrE
MGGLGTGNGRFYGPTGIAVDANGTVYVGDAGNSLIQVFDSDLHFARQWTATAGGSLAVDPTGQVLYEVYIGRVFTYDISTGALLDLWSFGQYGDHQDPCGFALDPSGALLVSAHTWVLRLSPSGSLLGQWGSEGTGDGQFSAAKAVAVDGSGNVYVGDAARVQKFAANGDFLTKWGTPGTQDGGFTFDQFGIAVDRNDAVFVLDSGQDRIQKFRPITTEASSHSWGSLKALYR